MKIPKWKHYKYYIRLKSDGWHPLLQLIKFDGCILTYYLLLFDSYIMMVTNFPFFKPIYKLIVRFFQINQ